MGLGIPGKGVTIVAHILMHAGRLVCLFVESGLKAAVWVGRGLGRQIPIGQASLGQSPAGATIRAYTTVSAQTTFNDPNHYVFVTEESVLISSITCRKGNTWFPLPRG